MDLAFQILILPEWAVENLIFESKLLINFLNLVLPLLDFFQQILHLALNISVFSLLYLLVDNSLWLARLLKLGSSIYQLVYSLLVILYFLFKLLLLISFSLKKSDKIVVFLFQSTIASFDLAVI